MSTHEHVQDFERWCDVAVVGGSAAGLAGALMLARSRRSVIVIDAGEPRNAPAAHMHGYLGYEGRSPADLLAAGRAEVRSYGVEILEARVESVIRDERGDDGFRVMIVGGGRVAARKVLVATGAVDRLPELDGLREHWGSQVIHCPYCHGWEVRGQRIVVLGTNRWAPHQASLFGQLSDRVTVVVHQSGNIDAATRGELDQVAGEVVDVPGRRIVTDRDGRLTGIELVDGRVIEADAVVVSTRVEARGEMLASIGIEATEHPSGIGTVVDIDDLGQTAVSGVYAAGNVTDPSLQVLPAAAAGSRTGAIINAHLVEDDKRGGGTPPNEWDLRYGARDQVWSGNPNGTLVAEVAGLTPGRALDVGCGEGGDAVWLAQQGWSVTALDVSQVAVDRALAAAAQRGVAIDGVCADLPGAGFAPGSFELVSVQYPAIPRTPEGEALVAMLDAVAVGGTLLAVFHDLDDPNGPHQHHVRPFDHQAYVRVDDVVAALDPAHWTIEVHETRDRPGGHAAASPHVRDVVVRAVRRQPG